MMPFWRWVKEQAERIIEHVDVMMPVPYWDHQRAIDQRDVLLREIERQDRIIQELEERCR